MKIKLRGLLHPDTASELLERGAEELIGPVSMGMFFDTAWPDEGFAEFLEEFRHVDGIDFNVWMEFSRKDTAKARFLLALPSRVIRDSDADFERTRAHIDTLPWHGSDPVTQYRIVDRLYLSRFRLKPNQVASAGEGSAELVAHESAYDTLARCNLTGLSMAPVLNTTSGLPNPEHVMLYTDSVLPARIFDLTCPRIPSPHPEERGYELLGCLCYPSEALDAAADVNRTSENLVSFEFPEWVVSRKTVDCFTGHKLKGLRFEPVLEDLTATYDEYLGQWGSLYDAMSRGRYTIRSMRPWGD